MKHRQGDGVKCTFYSHQTLHIIVTTRNRHSNIEAGVPSVDKFMDPTATRIYVSFERPLYINFVVNKGQYNSCHHKPAAVLPIPLSFTCSLYVLFCY
jgi:hypothetical protein